MALTVRPFTESKELNAVRTALNTNVPKVERVVSVVTGVGLLIYGLSRRSLGGLLFGALGGALVNRGANGHCALYEKLGVNSRQLNGERGVPGEKGIKIVRTITVTRPAQEVYRYWRKLENLSRFMDHVKSVRELDAKRSVWVVKGPLGHDVKWMAQLISDQEGKMISWESLPGSEVRNAGSVWFEPSERGIGTDVKVSLKYLPPAGAVGAGVAKLFGENPEQQLDDDLGRFKKLIETDAVETIAAI